MGLDAQLNDVISIADRTNLLTGIKTSLDTRYPNGENQMNYFGLYLQHLKKIKAGTWVLNDGIRLQATWLHSTIRDNSFFNLPVTDFKQSPVAVTANLGIVHMPKPGIRYHANLSSGFRAPNIDDVSRIFESSTALKRVIIPNAEIGPEYTYNLDIGLSREFKNKIRFELSGFYTLFRDAIALAPFELNGRDSVDYNGTYSAVYANRNVNKAFVTGFNTRLRFNFNETMVFDNTFSFTYGRYLLEKDSKKPMDHIPPVFGKSSLSYTHSGFGFECYMIYNGWKRIEDFNPDGEDNGQYATPDGMPCWLTLNARANYDLGKHLLLQAGIENILDRNYRYFASGFSAPGRNLILSVRASF
jgi:hemoglobin/transferrin/lactoferrin receptor protein